MKTGSSIFSCRVVQTQVKMLTRLLFFLTKGTELTLWNNLSDFLPTEGTNTQRSLNQKIWPVPWQWPLFSISEGELPSLLPSFIINYHFKSILCLNTDYFFNSIITLLKIFLCIWVCMSSVYYCIFDVNAGHVGILISCVSMTCM